jgi:wobble nucleotide-excising tRNase
MVSPATYGPRKTKFQCHCARIAILQQAALSSKQQAFDTSAASARIVQLQDEQQQNTAELHRLTQTIQHLNQFASQQATITAKANALASTKASFAQSYVS